MSQKNDIQEKENTKTSQRNNTHEKENTTKKSQNNVIKDKENTKKLQKNDIKGMNKKYKNKKDNILALKDQDFMNRMINTPIMTESEVGLVNSLAISILETSLLDGFLNKESD